MPDCEESTDLSIPKAPEKPEKKPFFERVIQLFEEVSLEETKEDTNAFDHEMKAQGKIDWEYRFQEKLIGRVTDFDEQEQEKIICDATKELRYLEKVINLKPSTNQIARYKLLKFLHQYLFDYLALSIKLDLAIETDRYPQFIQALDMNSYECWYPWIEKNDPQVANKLKDRMEHTLTLRDWRWQLKDEGKEELLLKLQEEMDSEKWQKEHQKRLIAAFFNAIYREMMSVDNVISISYDLYEVIKDSIQDKFLNKTAQRFLENLPYFYLENKLIDINSRLLHAKNIDIKKLTDTLLKYSNTLEIGSKQITEEIVLNAVVRWHAKPKDEIPFFSVEPVELLLIDLLFESGMQIKSISSEDIIRIPKSYENEILFLLASILMISDKRLESICAKLADIICIKSKLPGKQDYIGKELQQLKKRLLQGSPKVNAKNIKTETKIEFISGMIIELANLYNNKREILPDIESNLNFLRLRALFNFENRTANTNLIMLDLIQTVTIEILADIKQPGVPWLVPDPKFICWMIDNKLHGYESQPDRYQKQLVDDLKSCIKMSDRGFVKFSTSCNSKGEDSNPITSILKFIHQHQLTLLDKQEITYQLLAHAALEEHYDLFDLILEMSGYSSGLMTLLNKSRYWAYRYLLHAAVGVGDLKMVQILVKKCPKDWINLRDNNKKTPLDLVESGSANDEDKNRIKALLISRLDLATELDSSQAETSENSQDPTKQSGADDTEEKADQPTAVDAFMKFVDGKPVPKPLSEGSETIAAISGYLDKHPELFSVDGADHVDHQGRTILQRLFEAGTDWVYFLLQEARKRLTSDKELDDFIQNEDDDNYTLFSHPKSKPHFQNAVEISSLSTETGKDFFTNICLQKHAEFSQILQDNPDVIKTTSIFGSNCFHLVARLANNNKFLETLLSYLTEDTMYLLKILNRNGFTPLHMIALNTELELLCKLCDTMPLDYINMPDSASNTLLHDAVREGQDGFVRYLLRHPFTNPNIKNKDGQTPLSIAIGEQLTQIIVQFLQEGVGIDTLDPALQFDFINFFKIKVNEGDFSLISEIIKYKLPVKFEQATLAKLGDLAIRINDMDAVTLIFQLREYVSERISPMEIEKDDGSLNNPDEKHEKDNKEENVQSRGKRKREGGEDIDEGNTCGYDYRINNCASALVTREDDYTEFLQNQFKNNQSLLFKRSNNQTLLQIIIDFGCSEEIVNSCIEAAQSVLGKEPFNSWCQEEIKDPAVKKFIDPFVETEPPPKKKQKVNQEEDSNEQPSANKRRKLQSKGPTLFGVPTDTSANSSLPLEQGKKSEHADDDGCIVVSSL